MSPKFLALNDYIVAQNPGLSADEMFVIMWTCDMQAYLHLGESITGAAWHKTEFGVAPAEFI